MTTQEAIGVLEGMLQEMMGENKNLAPVVEKAIALKMAIEDLKEAWVPMVTNEDGAIISRLPDDGEDVLITIYGETCIDSFGCDFEYDESTGEGRYEWFLENNDIEDVKAWRPLPKPWKGEA